MAIYDAVAEGSCRDCGNSGREMSSDDVGVAEDEDFPVFRNTADVVPANGETCVKLNTEKKKKKKKYKYKDKK